MKFISHVFKHHSIQLLVVLIGVAGLFGSPLTAKAQFGTPPPPVGPPLASADALKLQKVSFPVDLIRMPISDKVNEFLTEANKTLAEGDNYRAKIRLIGNSDPSDCGHACLTRPVLRATQFADMPNSRFAEMELRLAFEIYDIKKKGWRGRFRTLPGIKRTIRVTSKVSVSCQNWDSKNAKIRIATRQAHIHVDDSNVTVTERILNALLPPARITHLVTNRLQSQLTNLPSEMVEFPFDCASLGVVTGSGPDDDYIVWDKRKAKSLPDLLQPPAPANNVQVRFSQLKRLPVGSNFDTQERDLTLYMYVNGRQLRFPKFGEFSLDTDEALSMTSPGGSASISIPKEEVGEKLQILLVLRDGNTTFATEWVEFAKSADYGLGSRRMKSKREVSNPPLRPGEKPLTLTLREYELTYHIRVGSVLSIDL